MGDIKQKWLVIIRIVFLLLVLISRSKLAEFYCERIKRMQSRHLECLGVGFFPGKSFLECRSIKLRLFKFLPGLSANHTPGTHFKIIQSSVGETIKESSSFSFSFISI